MLARFDVICKGERVLAVPGVTGQEYGFLIMLSAPEPEALVFVCKCEGEGSSGKLAWFA